MAFPVSYMRLAEKIQKLRILREWRRLQGEWYDDVDETITNLRVMQVQILNRAGWTTRRIPIGQDLQRNAGVTQA